MVGRHGGKGDPTNDKIKKIFTKIYKAIEWNEK